MFYVALAIVAAYIALQVGALRRCQGRWRVAAWLPAGALSLLVVFIAVGLAVDPTSHNLWPFEIVLWAIGSVAYLLVLRLLHAILRRAPR